ncbi:MAG: branched-chain amino acid ABC transporter permease [Clostridia bacterium]|nr:branched-chain amino acid ABC transporter permease [Clostridia bacterium]
MGNGSIPATSPGRDGSNSILVDPSEQNGQRNRTKLVLTLAGLVVIFALLYWLNGALSGYQLRILSLAGINAILAVSLNLIFGFTGLFSLGHAGFMAVGAYVCALLTLPTATKESIFLLTPLVWPFNAICLPPLISVIGGGVAAALLASLIGLPVLRLRGDYLGIATLGFAEIIRVVGNNIPSITNGALGLKGIPNFAKSLWWTWGWAIVTIWVVSRLVNSMYGKSLLAVKEDEVAAEIMGVNLTYHKTVAYVVGSFFAGIGGALLGSLITTIDPKTFNFMLTFNILIIVVAGGLGSITGSVIASVLYTVLLEALRPIEASWRLGPLAVPEIPGLRMVVFSLVLLVIILFYQKGLFGGREFSWDPIIRLFERRRGGGASRDKSAN